MRYLLSFLLFFPLLAQAENPQQFEQDKNTVDTDKRINRIVEQISDPNFHKIKVGSFTSSASTGNQSVTGVGFRPRFVQFSLLVGGAGHTAYSASGEMDSSGNQWATSAQSSDATDGGVHATVSITNGCIKIYPTSQASYVSMDSDGFTINWNDVAFGATPIGYIAFE